MKINILAYDKVQNLQVFDLYYTGNPARYGILGIDNRSDEMKGIDLKPELDELVRNISQKNGYYGNKIPASIMAMFIVEIDEFHSGIVVPYWLSVLQRGRGPRRSGSTKDYGLSKIIYRWMEKRGMFRSGTAKGKLNEARSMTWYINKYGNAHFRSKTFVDVYESERKKTIEKIDKKFGEVIHKITMNVI